MRYKANGKATKLRGNRLVCSSLVREMALFDALNRSMRGRHAHRFKGIHGYTVLNIVGFKITLTGLGRWLCR